MKESRLLLLILCVVGAGACLWAYKHGPVTLPNQQQQQKAFEAPPGWTPTAPAPIAPPSPSPKMTPPAQPPIPKTPPVPGNTLPRNLTQPRA